MTIRGDFSRQGFLGADSERSWPLSRVAIVGLGGGGSHIGQQLAHLGVGHYRLIDPQEIDASNLNRLVGATERDVEARTSKVKIMESGLSRAFGRRRESKSALKEWQMVDDLIKDAHVNIRLPRWISAWRMLP